MERKRQQFGTVTYQEKYMEKQDEEEDNIGYAPSLNGEEASTMQERPNMKEMPTAPLRAKAYWTELNNWWTHQIQQKLYDYIFEKWRDEGTGDNIF